MKYINLVSGQEVEFEVGDRVIFDNKHEGTVMNETDVYLDFGDIVKSLRTQTHKFVNISRPLENKPKSNFE